MSRSMRITATLFLALILFPALASGARIKDIAQLEGVRNNQLVGYGLVVGLNGTGDSAGTMFTIQSLVNMLERLGVTVDKNVVKVNNVAAVIVTAKLPPFAKSGSTIDVMISSVGDSKNLSGGSLLMTPLKGPDGEIYAVAQGPVTIGALAFGGEAASVQKNHPTVGRIPGGAIIEREVQFALNPDKALSYRLREADFTTASRMAAAINDHYAVNLAKAMDSGTIDISIPLENKKNSITFIADLENIIVEPDTVAKIVVNEKTGTIVMGSQVRLSTVAITHANLSLVISETGNVSQPNPLAGGQTMMVPETEINLKEDKANLMVLESGVSIGEVANALNAIGASPRDLIAIFQAIKAAGGLHAELVVL